MGSRPLFLFEITNQKKNMKSRGLGRQREFLDKLDSTPLYFALFGGEMFLNLNGKTK